MESKLQIFKNSDFGEIRTVIINNEPWFVGKDVAKALGYNDTSDALKRHIEQDDKLTRCFTDSGQNRSMYIINESGLYSLILSSKLPTAKQFKHWVTSEVLPAIHKTGGYVSNDEMFINTYLPFADEQTKLLFKSTLETVRSLNHKIKADRPKVLFAEAVETSHSSILVNDLAKLIKQNGYDIGQNRLFKWLRDHGYLIKRKGADYNSPTQHSMDMNLFEIKERVISNPDGSTRITRTTKVTGKGQIYFISKFAEVEHKAA